MNRKKFLKGLFFVIVSIIVIAAVYNIGVFLIRGKQQISVKTATTYYTGNDISATVSVKKVKKDKLIDAKVIAELYDDKEKKVKEIVAAEVKTYEDLAGVQVETEDTAEEEPVVKAQMPKEVKRSMMFLLASIFLWFTAYNAVTTAFSRYTKVVWKLEGGGFADCLMVATVAAIISYIPIGAISSKIGRKKTILIGIVLLAFCYLCAGFYHTYHVSMNLFFGIIGFAWAAIGVNSLPMVVEISAAGDVGKYTGYYYTFSMSAQVITPILSGFLLENVSYRTLFPYAVVFSCLAFCTMLMVKHGDSKPQQKKSVLESFDVDD